MKCQDVRRTLSPFVDGQLALTEWAIIQGHVLECAECRNELDRLRGLAGVRARARRRRATAMTGAAMALVLAVAALGGFLIYRGSFPDLPWWGTPPPPRAVIPTVPAPESVRPAPVPAPLVRPAPPLEQPAPPLEQPAAPSPTGTTGTAEVTPRSTTPPAPPPRPAASAEAPPQDRMPTTQARPPVVVNAPPDAEAMPTQSSPSGRAPRSRR
jgi:hypothetical protein